VRLEAEALVVRYGARAALAGVDLVIAPGERVAVLGPSGSGKTTLLRALHLLVAPTSGRVRVDDAVAGDADRRAALSRFGLLQQRPGLVAGTALANVAFPLRARGLARRAAEARARDALARVGLAERAEDDAARLSGGEAQRVALARAVVADPEVILVDEGTNQLDPATARVAESVLLEEARRGASLVVVTHSPAQARRLAARVAFLDGGRVVADGPTAAVLDHVDSPAIRAFVERA